MIGKDIYEDDAETKQLAKKSDITKRAQNNKAFLQRLRMEYELILVKKSKLSKIDRDKIIEAHTTYFGEDF